MDHSILSEMARRLRSAERWDNAIADKLQFYTKRVDDLEAAVRVPVPSDGAGYREIRRPLASWEDCRRVVAAIAGSRTSSICGGDVESCLTLAVLLYRWQEKGLQVPSDVRSMDTGAVAVEWDKKNGDRMVIIQHGVVMHGKEWA